MDASDEPETAEPIEKKEDLSRLGAQAVRFQQLFTLAPECFAFARIHSVLQGKWRARNDSNVRPSDS